MDERKPLLVNQKNEKPPGGIKDAAVIKNIGLTIIILLSTCGADLAGQAISQYIIKLNENEFTSNKTAIRDKHDPLWSALNSTADACGHNISRIQENDGQKHTAHFNWHMALIERIISIPVILIAGLYSDQKGRKPLLMFCTVGSFLQYASYFYLMYMEFSLYYFVIPAVIAGINGLRIPFSLALAAAVSDTTHRNHHRSLAFAILDVTLGIGGFAATMSAGYFIGCCGYLWPVFTCACVYFVSIFIVHFTVKETLNQKTCTVPAKGYKSSYLDRVFGFFYDEGRIKDNPKWKFILCFTAFIVLELAATVSSGIDTMYRMSFPLCWNSKQLGWYTASLNFIHSTIGALCLKCFQFCARDDVITVLAFLSSTGYYICKGFSTRNWHLYVAAGVGFFSSMGGVIIRALMTIMVDEADQGAFLTVYYTWANLISVSGSTVSNNVYAATESVFKGIVYFISAGVYLLDVILLLILVAKGGIKGKPSKKAQTVKRGTQSTETMESCY